MNTLYELHITCPLTGLSKKISGPYHNKILIDEEKDMYERHIPSSFAIFLITIRDPQNNPLSFIERVDKDDNAHNCFNAKFKPATTTTIIPEDPNDSHDLPWVLTFDSIPDEKKGVTHTVDNAAVDIYKKNSNIIEHCHSLYGSLWHHGFVRHLIDFRHCSHAKKIYDWITEIGNKYDPIIISKLNGGNWRDGIYVGNFYTSNVQHLCEYCSRMFGVNKFDVAKLFELKDPAGIHFPDNIVGQAYNEKLIAERAYNEKLIAAIFAERGDIESARKYYAQSVQTLEGQTWQTNYKSRQIQFEKYVVEHGTSILSSNF